LTYKCYSKSRHVRHCLLCPQP